MKASDKNPFELVDLLLDCPNLDNTQEQKLYTMNKFGNYVGLLKEDDVLGNTWYKIPLVNNSEVFSVTRNVDSAYTMFVDHLFEKYAGLKP